MTYSANFAMKHKMFPFYLFAVLHEYFCETIYSYSDNKIFLLKNSCKYFWSTLKKVIFAGTKFCRYQIWRLTP